jgi:hypothetical protein
MDNISAVTELKSIGDGKDNLTDILFRFAPFEIFFLAEFASLHELHHNIKIIPVIINLINLNNVGVFQLKFKNNVQKAGFRTRSCTS